MQAPLILLARVAALALLVTLPRAQAHGDAHKHTGAHKHPPSPSLTPMHSPVSSPPPPHDTSSHSPPPQSILGLSKRLYSVPGRQNETQYAGELKRQYATLEAEYAKINPTLGDALGTILEIRLEELQASIDRAREMLRVLTLLKS
jgi:hypothetical protein